MEAFVLSAYPIGKHHVEMVHDFNKFGFAEFVVVVVPSLYLAFDFYCYMLKFPIKMLMEFPFFHLFVNLHDRLLADGWKKVGEALLLPSIPCLATLKGIAEEVKGVLNTFYLSSSGGGTLDNLGLLNIEFQVALFKAVGQHLL